MIYASTITDDKEWKNGWHFVNSIKFVVEARPEDLKYCKNLERFVGSYSEELDDLSFLPDADIRNIALLDNCKDLSGLQRFNNIETLSLLDYKHDDLEYITELSCLEELYITSDNSIDISEIGKLSSLERLFFYANEFDCNDLLGLDNLTYLSVGVGENNKIENVESLLGLGSLQTVHVRSEDMTEEDIQLLEDHGIEVEVD